MPDQPRLGPFVVERELGRGGMGVVYAALHEGRRVALKVSLDEVSERDRRHFLDEAELVARVAHPAIVGILGSGTFEDGRPYIVMPLLEGETLGARLARGAMAPAKALALWAELADAVVALHDAGVVHRDIKPENVMVRGSVEGAPEDPHLVLLDFGIARDAERPASTTTRMNLVRGTPGCMAPERFFGVRASEASDVYELTVVLYAMLVGRLPWDDPTDPESRLRPRLPSEIGIDLPIGLGHILLEGLSTKPERRPSAKDLAARVRAVEHAPLAGGAGGDTALARVALPPMESPPPRARSIAPEAETWTGRWRGAAAAWVGAAIGVAGIIVTSALVVRARRAASPPASDAALAPPRPSTPEPEAAQVTAPAGGPPASAVSATAADAARGDPTPNASATSTSTSTASALPSAPSAALRALPSAATAPPPVTVVPGGPPPPPQTQWCARLAELYCTPAARRMPDGEARCTARRADAAKVADLPDTTRMRGEASCKDAIPALERSIRTPQASEAAEDLPWCKRVVAAYCAPDVRSSAGGEGLCAGGERAWGARLNALPPAERAAQNEQCSRLLPAVVQAMKQHLRDFAPGTAASARLNGVAPPPPASATP